MPATPSPSQHPKVARFATEVAIPTGELLARMKANAAHGIDTSVTPDEVGRLFEFLRVLRGEVART